MTQDKWDNATDEERNAERERCKDPVYLYNTYWKPAVKPAITREKWEELQLQATHNRIWGRSGRPIYIAKRPMLLEESYPRIKPMSTKVSENIMAYMKTFVWAKKEMSEAVGIPAERIGVGYDPINRDISKAAFKAMVEDTVVMTRTYFDMVTNTVVTEIIRPQKTARLPRKLKKVVKAKCKLGRTNRANLVFNLEVLKLSKYYSCKILKEK